nr:class I SAM-dependent methyltransferase [Candidatus Sigynarchaeota archaeon]
MKESGYDTHDERLALLEFGNVHCVDLLDIGAGHGELAIIAAGIRGCLVTCIDPDPAKLALVAEAASRAGLLGRIKLEVGDARRLHFPDKHFTCVECYSVLHHVSRDDRDAVVAEAVRVAREKVLFSELTTAGAKFFDEILHPGEDHVANIINKAWLVSRLEGLGKIDTVDRTSTYFVMLVK